jgi:tetratricopeptide (TPR) repeat protein
MGRLAEAESLFQAVAERLEAQASAFGAPAETRRGLSQAYAKWAEVQAALGRAAGARGPLHKAIEYGEAFCRDHPQDAPAQSSLANSYYFASLDARNRGQHQRALERVRQARAIQENVLRQEPYNQSYLRGLLFSLNGEGLHLRKLGRPQEAVAVYRHELALAREMLRRDPQDRWAQMSVTVAYNALGEGLLEALDVAAGLQALRKAYLIGERVVAEDPANGFARNELAAIDANFGLALLARSPSRAREACRMLARSAAAWRELQSRGQLTADSADGLQRVEAELARCGGVPRPSRPHDE